MITDRRKDMKKLNLPNKLTVIRVAMIPFVMALVMIKSDATWLDIAAAVIFLAATLTDMFDGMIARRTNQVTNFGKFMDPLADKFLVFGTLFAMLANPDFDAFRFILVISVSILLFRELAVTSIRLIATKTDGTVIAANMLGKIKTVSQSVCILSILLAPHLLPDALGKFKTYHILEYITIAVMLFFTVISGYTYIKKYASYIDLGN